MRVDKVWGYEEIFHNDEFYCGKLLHLNEGFACSLHYHPIKRETFYLIKGCMRVITLHEGDRHYNIEWVYPGATIELEPNTPHSFGLPIDEGRTRARVKKVEEGFCEFIEVSTQHFDSDSIRLISSGAIDG